MVAASIALGGIAFLLAAFGTWLCRTAGLRLRALDGPGVPGQRKAPPRRVPNTGGIAIFWAITLPFGLGLLAVDAAPDVLSAWIPGVARHLEGIALRSRDALVVAAAAGVLHATGVVDDRRPLGPYLKLAIMTGASAAVVLLTEQSRLLTMVDPYVGGPWLSAGLSVLWLVVVMNAMNMMDNMDGLAGGTTCVAGSTFLVSTLLNGQWFVASCLALLVGATGGFLVFNFPWRRAGATIFMGDGGSLVIGFWLGFLTMRCTFYGTPSPEAPPAAPAGAWYAVFMPVVVLAIPLYDFLTVVALRLSQGRSPFVGDLQHFSHRLVRTGLSRRAAVLVICGLAGVTSIAGISLPSLRPWQAALVGVQTLLVLAVLAAWEWSAGRDDTPAPGART